MQLSPGARLAPVSVSVLVPLICEPLPQTSLAGSPTATRPVRVASRSSVNAMAVASPGALASACRVNSSVAVSPALTGLSMNDLLSRGAATTVSESLAAGPVTGLPATVAVTLLVVLG